METFLDGAAKPLVYRGWCEVELEPGKDAKGIQHEYVKVSGNLVTMQNCQVTLPDRYGGVSVSVYDSKNQVWFWHKPIEEVRAIRGMISGRVLLLWIRPDVPRKLGAEPL